MNEISLDRGFLLECLVGVGLNKNKNEKVMLKCLVGDFFKEILLKFLVEKYSLKYRFRTF